MKRIFIIFLLIMLVVFIPSCNKEDDNDDVENEIDNNQNNNASNEQDNNNENNITPVNYNVTYYVNDRIYYKCETLNNEELFLPRFIRSDEENTSYLYEVEWYDEETLVTNEYRLKQDVSLHAKILVQFEFSHDILITKLIYTSKKHVTIPETFYWNYYYTYTLSSEEGGDPIYQIEEYECKLGNDFAYELLVVFGSDTYFLGNGYDENKTFEIEELTVYADTFNYGIGGIIKNYAGQQLCFRKNDYIKRINIIGDVPEIRRASFASLPNLETVTVYGNVGNIHEAAFYECPNAKLEVIPNVIEVSNEGINLTLKIDDQIYYQNKIKPNQKLSDFLFIRDYLGITNDINNILEVEWYHNDICLDGEYELTEDIVLEGKIKTVLGCEREFIIRKIINNETNTVTIPSKCLDVIEIDNEQVLEIRKCKVYDSGYEVFWYKGDTDESKNNLLEGASVEHLIIYGDCFLFGISTKTFADNDVIKTITIKGSVIDIRNSAFYNLSNLELIKIEGDVMHSSGVISKDCNPSFIYIDSVSKN